MEAVSLDLALVLLVGLAAGTFSGIVGTGSSIALVPILAWAYGPKEAVPIMAVAAVMANAGRVLAWWREIDARALYAYALAGAPAAVLGARTLLVLPPRAVDLAIGAFLLAMIPGRRVLGGRAEGTWRLSYPQMAAAGAAIGFLTGIVVSTGPLSVPVFLGAGLAKGALIGTEAAASLAVYAAKTLTFRASDALPATALLRGLAVGASLMAGAFLAKPFVLRLSPDAFRLVMDGLLAASGLAMVAGALRA